ncbi:2-keto-3-deoxygluconate permease [Enteractinococcus fodinae]|uniref:2-keto-3-deoxygluconate permease n=1 Tax=Enteractinococcus fodinae TaxID=684663 RepID=A0ABU2B2X4_9MICC|nr:2-keto-3-deoxygluconate permease [Enteractinococcus fodinae]MDR7347940.1 2-keto-3-deoxygluconate permease [Enteractinococcus fodinae]
MDHVFKLLGRIPGAIMIVPLFLGALINSFFPEILDIGSFTTALFRDGLPVLIGLFFLAVGSQINVKAALPSVEKGLVLLLAKYGMAVAAGLSVAFFTPNGVLFGLLPLAIIAAMSNSNGSLYVALTGQFGNRTDKGAISVLSVNDGPFLTMIAMGVAGLASFPILALFAAIFPMILGFVLGNTSEKAREFLAPGERLIIPFAAFAIGTGIDFEVLLGDAAIGVLLGIATAVLSGGAAVGALYLWHVARKHPRPTRNLVAGVSEASVAGNAIATPAAVAAIDPSFLEIADAAAAQIAAAVVTTSFVLPFVVAWFAGWQRKRGITPENEDALYHSDEESAVEADHDGTGSSSVQPEGNDDAAPSVAGSPSR